MAIKISKESVIRGMFWGLLTAGGLIAKEVITGSNAPDWIKGVASSIGANSSSSSPPETPWSSPKEMDYYTLCDRREQRKFEMEKIEKQNRHEERLAEIRANAITIEPKQEESPNADTASN